MEDDLEGLGYRERLTVQSTARVKDRHIPYANPFVSKLVGLGLDVVRRHRPDLMIGWYWEPYGVAASVVGRFLNIPVALMHAGSDLGRLAQQPTLSSTYAMCLESAQYVVTGRNEDARASLDALGVDPGKRVHASRRLLPNLYFDTKHSMDFFALTSAARSYFQNLLASSVDQARVETMLARQVPAGVPVLGIYGKMGDAKGTLELMAALDEVAGRGKEFYLMYVGAGERRQFVEVFEYLSTRPRVESRCCVLPPIAPWQIPRFLKACDAAFFLENRFPIVFHTPSVPNEILASGTALICSGEIAAKLPYRSSLVDGKNIIIVPDPRDIAAFSGVLDFVLSDRNRLLSIGRHGRQVVEHLRDSSGDTHLFSALLDRFRRDVLRTTELAHSR